MCIRDRDKFLNDAIEVDIDLLCDGKDVYVAGIMEHIEEAGIHSGDSGCSLPPYTLSDKIVDELKCQASKLAMALKVIGLMNAQFAIKDNQIFLLEANPRASRTAPFVSKAIGLQLAKLGALVMSGITIEELNLPKEIKNNEVRKWKNLFLPLELTRGIFTFIIEHTEGNLPMPNRFNDASINKLDHVVITTNDADGFIEIYRDIFDIRLALDKVIEHWNTRMLFFRLNETTIEVVAKEHNNKNPDELWGLAWEVESIANTRKRLINEGAVSYTHLTLPTKRIV